MNVVFLMETTDQLNIVLLSALAEEYPVEINFSTFKKYISKACSDMVLARPSPKKVRRHIARLVKEGFMTQLNGVFPHMYALRDVQTTIILLKTLNHFSTLRRNQEMNNAFMLNKTLKDLDNRLNVSKKVD
jgi:hypothetical protein